MGGRIWRAWTCAIALCAGTAAAADREFIAGTDVSMLPEIERAGGVFRSGGKAGDAITILREGGVNLFRLRVFVDPGKEFAPSWGATQDLEMMKGLARRVKEAKGLFLLDLHYSDTWADPAKQFKPKAWEGLDAAGLEAKVHEYTAGVLKEFKEAGAPPDMVQVGNEITGGMLWPEGKVLGATPEKEAGQWAQFVKFFNAGARAAREFDPAVRVVIHIDGGGKPGRAKWFFGKFDEYHPDYDVMALSFYPAWGDEMGELKKNLSDAIGTWHKDVLIAETSYPWKPMKLKEAGAMKWPETPEGQKQFVEDLTNVIQAAPEGHGMGFVWWYPEAVRAGNLRIWRGGAEALFDETGETLPALKEFGRR